MAKPFKIRPLDIIGLLAAAAVFAFAWGRWQQPGMANAVLAIALALCGARIAYEFTWNRGRIPTVSTGPLQRRKIAALLQADAAGKSNYRILDLGSGRGELTRTLARAIPQAQITGIEFARGAHMQAVFWQKIFRLRNATYECRDLFTYDCSAANAVVLFLGRLTVPAGEKLRRELKPGTLVISHDFPLQETWPPVDVVTLYMPFKATLYVYRA